MKRFLPIFLLSVLSFNFLFAQTDKALVASWNKEVNHYIFKKDIKINVRDLITYNLSELGLDNDYKLVESKPNFTDEHGKTFVFEQFYKGVKIDGAKLFVKTNMQDIPTDAYGYILYNLNIEGTPSINEKSAIKLAYGAVPKTNSNTATSVNATANNGVLHADLLIIDGKLRGIKSDRQYFMAYKVPVMIKEPYVYSYYYIDAFSGEFLSSESMLIDYKKPTADNDNTKDASLNSNSNSEALLPCSDDCMSGSATVLYYGSQTIYTNKYTQGLLNCEYRTKHSNCSWDGNTYLYSRQYGGYDLLYDSGAEVYYFYMVNDAVDYHRDDNSWGTDHQVGTSALWSLEKTHDFFRSSPYNRPSYDAANSQVNIFGEVYDYPLPGGDNACWDSYSSGIALGSPGSNVFFNDPTSIDVVAHEYTHGITQTSADMFYGGESGAINESTSDIFGYMVDYYVKTNFSTGLTPNYTRGEECTNANRRTFLDNPHAGNQPDTYGSNDPFWVDPNSSTDFGGVHTNCGIQNYWFYLLCEGGSDVNENGDAYCVYPIGRDKAAKVLWWCLTHGGYGSNTNYSLARYWSIYEAGVLYGTTSYEVAQVTNAWHAVGVGAAYSGVIDYNNYTNAGTNELHSGSQINMANLQVPSGTSFTVTSATKIVITPASVAASGSYFHAYIESDCFEGTRLANVENGIVQQDNVESLSMELKPETEEESFSLWPNPSDGTFNLKCNFTFETGTQIVIANMLGSIVYENATSIPNAIDLSSQPKGIYFIRLKHQDKVFTKKLIIQ